MKVQRYVLNICLLAAVTLGYRSATAAQAPLPVYVNPSRISMGMTYNGNDVFVSGTLPKDAEVLIRVRGRAEDEHFKQKGRALGLLWMNMGTVEIDHAPSMMLLVPSDDLTRLMTQEPESWRKLGLGFDALEQEIEIAPRGMDKRKVIEEFLKLKQRDGLYGIQQNAVRYVEEDTGKAFHAEVHFPSALTPGTYTIETFAIRNGEVLAQDAHALEAHTVGMPAFLSALAFNHSLLYGILAVLVAIGAGIFIGYLFRGGGGGAH